MSAVRTSASSVASGPELRFRLADRGRGFGRAEAEVEQGGDGVRGGAARRRARSAAAGAEGDAAGLVLQLVDDALGELGADALGAGDHRLVAARDGAVELVAGQRGEDGERDPGADALDRGQQPEPVALVARWRSRPAGWRPRQTSISVWSTTSLADRAERGEGAGRGGDEIADAADVDHGMIGGEAVEQAAELGDHGDGWHADSILR